MRRLTPVLALTITLALVSSAPKPASGEALHAPRNPLGAIIRITPSDGCEGPVPGDMSLLSGDGQHQAYVCRSGGNSSFFLYNTRRRQNIPMFGLPSGFAEPVFVSEKGNWVAVLSETPIPPGSEEIVGEWGLYLFARQSGRVMKILEDDVEDLGPIFGDDLCPEEDIVSFGKPKVVHVTNRGRTLVRFDDRTTTSGPCPGGAYFDLVP